MNLAGNLELIQHWKVMLKVRPLFYWRQANLVDQMLRSICALLIACIMGCTIDTSQNERKHETEIKASRVKQKNTRIDLLIDAIWADTNVHRDLWDSTRVDTFYFNNIRSLVEQLERGQGSSVEMINRIVYDQSSMSFREGQADTTHGNVIELNDSRAVEFFQIINDPRNFTWGECGTWRKSATIMFYSDDSLVGHLEIGCDHSQFRSDIEQMKFGLLTDEARVRLHSLLEESGKLR